MSMDSEAYGQSIDTVVDILVTLGWWSAVWTGEARRAGQMGVIDHQRGEMRGGSSVDDAIRLLSRERLVESRGRWSTAASSRCDV